MNSTKLLLLAFVATTTLSNCGKSVKITTKNPGSSGSSGNSTTPAGTKPLANGSFMPIGVWTSTSYDADALEQAYSKLSFSKNQMTVTACRFENSCGASTTYTLKETGKSQVGSFYLDETLQEITMYEFAVTSSDPNAPKTVFFGFGTESEESVLVYSSHGGTSNKVIYLIQE